MNRDQTTKYWRNKLKIISFAFVTVKWGEVTAYTEVYTGRKRKPISVSVCVERERKKVHSCEGNWWNSSSSSSTSSRSNRRRRRSRSGEKRKKNWTKILEFGKRSSAKYFLLIHSVWIAVGTALRFTLKLHFVFFFGRAQIAGGSFVRWRCTRKAFTIIIYHIHIYRREKGVFSFFFCCWSLGLIVQVCIFLSSNAEFRLLCADNKIVCAEHCMWTALVVKSKVNWIEKTATATEHERTNEKEKKHAKQICTWSND